MASSGPPRFLTDDGDVDGAIVGEEGWRLGRHLASEESFGVQGELCHSNAATPRVIGLGGNERSLNELLRSIKYFFKGDFKQFFKVFLKGPEWFLNSF